MGGPQPETVPLRGLSSTEVDERIRRGLVNRERRPVDRTYLRILLDHALPPINVALYGISLLLLVIGLPVDALVTAGPVLGYVLVGIWQETRAKRQLDRIALLHRPVVTALRGGAEAPIPPGDLVLGDVVLLRRGDEVPVDGELLDGELELDEAVLTGESDPVVRRASDRVRAGSACVSGEGRMLADRIGSASESARLLAEARATRVERTPVQRTLQRVILAVTGIVGVAGLLVGIRLLGTDAPLDEMVRAAAVLVALVPQGLLVVVTITYAIGALELTRAGAVVQRISAIEAMSHADTVCVDKTGTLTTGRIRLSAVEPASRLAALADVAASVDPPNATILALCDAAPGTRRPTAWQVPFSSARRWSALRFADGDRGVHVLGAPDVLLPALGAAEAASLAPQLDLLAASGRRVLLAARGPDVEARPERLPAPLRDVTVLAFAEELRPDTREILGEIAAAGAELKMLSGDDPRTLQAVAAAAGMAVTAPAAAAADLESDQKATSALLRGTLFGRVDPASKARFVGLLRAAGRYVAMIGDGVNDILALKRARLGIAMASGSAATRAVADIVLLGDDVRLLPRILGSGQRIVSSMMVTLELLLARTTSMVLIVAACAALGLAFPFTPRNNSLLALLTVGIPTVVLALLVAPARPPEHILRSSLRFAIPSGIGMALPALLGYWVVLEVSGDVALARTVLVNLTVLFGIGLITLVARQWMRPVVAPGERWRLWLLAAAMAAAFLLVLSLPPARAFFDLAPMALDLALLTGVVGVAWTVVTHLVTGYVGLGVGAAERGFDRVAGSHGGGHSTR